jgi:cell division septal protein FtsQ
MATAKISRNNQIIIYAILLIFVVGFFVYFFQQASTAQLNLGELNVSAGQNNGNLSNSAIKINLDLLGTDKFLNLRSTVAPTQSFQSGKRNPFVPQ